MKVLIIGYGSIARKHVNALREIDSEIELLALRSDRNADTEEGIKNIYSWDEVDSDLTFAIISNPTHKHYETLLKASELEVPIFLEKPPFHTMVGADRLASKLNKQSLKIYTAFNMRFLPVIAWLKNALVGKRVLEVQIYCGSYLPDWRPGRDYRRIYSANKEMGGGVHLDLIHEIDYAKWIFGEPTEVRKSLSTISDLEIDSIDCAHYFFQYENKVVTILLNYYRRTPKRTMEIVLTDEEWYADILNGIVKNSKGEILFESDVSMQDTYKRQLEYFLNAIKTEEILMNNLDESIETLKICLDDIRK